jgi:hypothetical protein
VDGDGGQQTRHADERIGVTASGVPVQNWRNTGDFCEFLGLVMTTLSGVRQGQTEFVGWIDRQGLGQTKTARLPLTGKRAVWLWSGV